MLGFYESGKAAIRSRAPKPKEPGRETTEKLMASPLCVFTFKLLKPPSYAGYSSVRVGIISTYTKHNFIDEN